MADERDVGNAAHAYEPRLAARLADSGADGLEHRVVREPVDRRPDLGAEGGADGDHDLVRPRPRLCLAALGDRRRGSVRSVLQLTRIEHVRERLEQPPAVALEAVAG